MNLDDAIRCVEQHIRPGMTVEMWQTTNCLMVRRVVFNDGETYADNSDKFASAIEAVELISELPATLDDFEAHIKKTAYAEMDVDVARNTPDYATDKGAPND